MKTKYKIPRSWSKLTIKNIREAEREMMRDYAKFLINPKAATGSPGVGKSCIAERAVRKMNRRRKRKNKIKFIRPILSKCDAMACEGFPHPTS